MEWYDFILFLHLAAAVGLLGGSVIGSPVVRAAVRRAGTTQELRAYLAVGRPFLVLEPASAVLVLASGAYLTQVAGFWTLGWLQVAVALWVVNALVAAGLVKPIMSRIAAAAAAQPDGEVGQELDELRRSPRWSVGGDLLAANDAAVLFLMAMGPGLAGSFVVVVLANLAVMAIRAIRKGSPPAKVHARTA